MQQATLNSCVRKPTISSAPTLDMDRVYVYVHAIILVLHRKTEVIRGRKWEGIRGTCPQKCELSLERVCRLTAHGRTLCVGCTCTGNLFQEMRGSITYRANRECKHRNNVKADVFTKQKKTVK